MTDLVLITSGGTDPSTLFEIGLEKKEIEEICQEGLIYFKTHQPLQSKNKEQHGYIDKYPNKRATWYCNEILENLDRYWEESQKNPDQWEGVKSYN